MGKTLAECRKSAQSISNKFAVSYIASTIPFAIYKYDHNGFNVYDVSLPFEIKSGLGTELRMILDGED